MSGERAGEASEDIAVASAHTPGVHAAIARAKLEWECTVDALPDLICLLDRSGQVLRINRVCERWNLGSIADVLGAGCTMYARKLRRGRLPAQGVTADRVARPAGRGSSGV